jgi:hypothetical protein
MNRSLLAVAAAGALAALPAVAGASTVTSVPTGPFFYNTIFTGDPGPNTVTLAVPGTPSGSQWTDSKPLTALTGCTAGTPVSCIGPDTETHLGGGQDRFTNTHSNYKVYVWGDDGADTITANGNVTVAYGGNGPDTIDINANGDPDGFGEAGADKLRGGGGNAFSTHLDGGDGPDLLVGWSTVDHLTGDAGQDALFSTFGGGTADGGDAADVIVNLGVHTHGFSAIGGGGPDTIVGAGATDTVDAGAGADVIDVAGDPGSADQVTCGPGRDTVYADADDVLTGCENVTVGPVDPTTLPGVADAVAELKATWPAHPTGSY